MSTETKTGLGKTPLIITRLSITNYGVIHVASILPDGSPVILAGDNGQGKSTVLSAIESMLYARKLAVPVTHGESKAKLELDLSAEGEAQPRYRIEQIIKAGEKPGEAASYNLKIFDFEKKQVPSPATFIESIIGSGAALDPIALMQPKPGERPETFAKRQAEILMDRLGLTAQAKTLDEQIEKLTAERKKANDEAETAKARFEAITVPKDTPDEPLDVSALAKEQSDLNQLKNQRQRLADKIGPKNESVAAAERRVAELERLLIENKETLAGAKKLATAAAEELEDFDEENPPAGIEKAIADVMAKLTNATAINAAVQDKVSRKQNSAEMTKFQGQAGTLTSALEKARTARLDLVRNAKLPVEGLELTTEALLYKGKPLIQESTGNQIRICSLLAMAEDPECRVLFIREGALTNAANRQIIYDIAEERGWQVWEEFFSETPRDGALWIQGGEVTEPPAKPKAQTAKGKPAADKK